MLLLNVGQGGYRSASAPFGLETMGAGPCAIVAIYDPTGKKPKAIMGHIPDYKSIVLEEHHGPR